MDTTRRDRTRIERDRTRKSRREDRIPFVSPYVEINSDNDILSTDRVDTTPVVEERLSINNSFLDEAEIISPSSEHLNAKAHHLMRKKIQYFFMNPIEKCQIKGRFPWKLCLQGVVIFFATFQLLNFGMRSYSFVSQHAEMTEALSLFLLKDWTTKVTVYPPDSGPYAVFTIPDFYENINHVIRQYSKVTTLPIGPYSYDNSNGTVSSMLFCAVHFNGAVFPENSTIWIHGRPTESCIEIPPLYPAGSELWDDFSLESFLKNFTLNFKTIINAKLHFKLRTIFVKTLTKLDIPECYKLRNTVSYDNGEHDGQLLISLKILATKVNCHVHSKVESDHENFRYLLRQLLNATVILLCFISVILYLRSLFSGYSLSREVVQFFKQYYNKNIPVWEQLDFIDFWYVNIIISDLMLIFGSLIKVQIEEKSAEGHEYNKCTIFLGVGVLLLFVGLLRYLGFFPTYNMLILTVKRAFPNVLRFSVCAVCLYVGFCLCGWIVLSPYHIKFRTLSSTSECLFAVMNGDDMFATFALMKTKNNLLWWFSRIYLYTFLFLFIYVVISLFISVIMDTFETIKMTYLHGSPPKTTVETFLAADTYASVPSSSPTPEITEPGIFRKSWDWFVSKIWNKRS